MIDLKYGEGNVLIPKNISDSSNEIPLLSNEDRECTVTDKLVKFCCTIDIPKCFEFKKNEPIKFFYDPTCLKPVIQSQLECIPSKCGPVWANCYCAQIIGCIPYLVNVPVAVKECGVDVVTNEANCNVTQIKNNKIGYICCKGDLCVDETLGKSTTPPTIPNLNCDSVKLIELGYNDTPVTVCNNNCRTLIVSGTLQLPDAIINKQECPPEQPQTTPSNCCAYN
ncbi:hypothetical protein AU387_10980 [Bacillus halotolerans]|uniref:hypothetical protein n=1 Tax=Bacillus halotolerans TaxID=260554 RepID=UPI0007518748|nr:hypothetical protein [Bacillus halotolerans]KUP32834.1 hypothetical protein AU387_10980 [Bacillus halotolerans]